MPNAPLTVNGVVAATAAVDAAHATASAVFFLFDATKIYNFFQSTLEHRRRVAAAVNFDYLQPQQQLWLRLLSPIRANSGNLSLNCEMLLKVLWFRIQGGLLEEFLRRLKTLDKQIDVLIHFITLRQ